jgi:hypothetical protein
MDQWEGWNATKGKGCVTALQCQLPVLLATQQSAAISQPANFQAVA